MSMWPSSQSKQSATMVSSQYIAMTVFLLAVYIFFIRACALSVLLF